MSSDSLIVRVSSDKYTSKVGEEITISVPSDLISRPAKSIRLLDAIIPNTFSNVPTTNNQFDFTDLNGTNTITIPNLTLNSTSILEELKSLLEANSGAGLTFTIIYNKCSGIYEFQADGSYTFDFTIANNAAALLGFDEAVYTAAETPPTSNIWVVETVRRNQFDINKYINITSDLVTGVDQGIVFLDGDLTPAPKNIIASIPISTSSAGSAIVYFESNSAPDINIQGGVLGQVVSPNTNTIREVKFGLSLDNGETVDLGGSAWSARFVIKFS